MSIEASEIGKRIRTLRTERRESQLKLSQALDVSRESVTKIEAGSQFPSAVVLARLSEHYHASVDYILFGEVKSPELVKQLDHAISILRSVQRKI